MQNLFKGASLVLRNGDPIENVRLGKSNMPALSASTGEFNAQSVKELCNNISLLMQAVASGQIVQEQHSALSTSEQYAKEMRDRREILAAAYNDPTGKNWAALGASMALRLQEQRDRAAFMRRICVGQTLKQGDPARVTMPTWSTQAVVATSSANVGFQVIRNKSFLPDEFEVIANVRAEQLDIEQVSGDILEDMYTQGLDSIMVQEDRVWKKAADLTVGTLNPLQWISGSLTPGMLARLRNGVTDWNLPATTAILSNDFWSDITGSADFANFLDPVTKYDLALNGFLGNLAGLNLVTDGFRQQTQKVLERGEIYIVATPENHAAYTDRGGIRATPTSGADNGSTTKGWLLSEILSFALVNPRSVQKGKRI